MRVAFGGGRRHGWQACRQDRGRYRWQRRDWPRCGQALRRGGPHVFITGRRQRELAAAKEIGRAATAIKADESFVQSLVPLNRIGLQALFYSLRRRQCYSAV
jgi:hypothetical protein